MQEKWEILWLQNKFQLILTASLKYRVQLQKWRWHTIACFQNMDKITNTETFANTLSSNSNKDCICTDDYLSYQRWYIQGST